MYNPIFIAEIGINHNGSVETAKKMIDMVVDAAKHADFPLEDLYVKFQKRNPDLAVPEDQKNKEKVVPWRNESTTYLQYKKDIEFEKAEYDIIDSYCKEKGIRWFASPWDVDSVEFLKQYNLPFIKLASASITDKELLEAVKSTGVDVIMSTGMSTEGEILEAMHVLGDSVKVIMHCNSSYPAKDEELNLAYLPILQAHYPDKVIGYSGHEEGISASLVANCLGANVIERHVTLSRSMWGTDQAASIIYDQLYKLLRDLNRVNVWIGQPIKRVWDSEKPIRKKLRGD